MKVVITVFFFILEEEGGRTDEEEGEEKILSNSSLHISTTSGCGTSSFHGYHDCTQNYVQPTDSV